MLHRAQNAASLLIQRVFRGHKAKEMIAIERDLQQLEVFAKPLIDKLKQLEYDAMKLGELVDRLKAIEHEDEDEISAIEDELTYVMKTTNKYTDNARINNTNQRFLTKYLRIRLKEFLDHKKVSKPSRCCLRDCNSLFCVGRVPKEAI